MIASGSQENTDSEREGLVKSRDEAVAQAKVSNSSRTSLYSRK